jgi:hypothetical protein
MTTKKFAQHIDALLRTSGSVGMAKLQAEVITSVIGDRTYLGIKLNDSEDTQFLIQVDTV